MPEKRKSKPAASQSGKISKFFILGGIILLLVGVFFYKNYTSKPESTTAETSEEMLDRYLEEGKPIFAFFHSNDCISCIDMIHTVEQVYPEFNGLVMLLDVNVYDPENQNLLRRAGITTIPTQVFIDSTGMGKVAIGVMPAEQLKTALQGLAGGSR